MSGAEVLTPDAFALDPIIPESQPPREELREFREEPIEPITAADPIGGKADESLQECLDRAAVLKIKDALDAAKGNRAVAAAALGVDRTTLYRLMKRLGLSEV
jgi:transcriptional regulator of acetoin/glycerol metabolism